VAEVYVFALCLGGQGRRSKLRPGRVLYLLAKNLELCDIHDFWLGEQAEV